MRRLNFSLGTMLGLSLVACAILSSRMPASADRFQSTMCPTFTAMKWVSPVSHVSGNRYMLQLIKHEMNCGQAVSWAKRLLVQHVPGPPISGYQDIVGGPPGYHCTAWQDDTGHAYHGRCKKINGGLYDPSFNWGPMS